MYSFNINTRNLRSVVNAVYFVIIFTHINNNIKTFHNFHVHTNRENYRRELNILAYILSAFNKVLAALLKTFLSSQCNKSNKKFKSLSLKEEKKYGRRQRKTYQNKVKSFLFLTFACHI
ncbi:CLUMA_CG002286, isoform A [Clunio marinus]|uniref:CLUMA_CG002286, isoform A n=1 Tax=Clunio marinus TaxID=568069 RepID=A0A1J1HKH4_9DIPT|nr:CLUMA_CG002286, isoform A [Clunio marinus]